MKLPQPSGGGNFAPTPAGAHIGVCYRLVDMGTQESSYMGETKRKRELMVSWLLPEELITEGNYAGKPHSQSEFYTFSMHEKAKLRQDLESWRGKAFVDSDFGPDGFDLRNILGKPCLLNLVHKESGGKTYTNLVSVSRLPKSMTAPAIDDLETVHFSLDPEDFDAAVYDELSDGLKSRIAKSPEYQALMRPAEQGAPNGAGHQMDGGPGPFDEFEGDSIPF